MRYIHGLVSLSQGDTGFRRTRYTGIKSNTVGGECYPLEKSSTVRAEGKLVVRHDDKFWMNGA
ncbi:PAAR-like domain-containing protein [Pseudomonas sp. MUP55]|uniref:PAAR-like domain-containing protein n=1 Tax=Pseudomonas sp. MUP55 TaxID=3087234 RepID=UPI002A5A6DC8|nr:MULTISPECIES: PAAR-like domain-containing protein [unclassified Pseudomonas]WPN94683.1 PAAR-like domain-containing protein [Pseudomonas sp. MUP56]WPO00210.1 PAAR-like domain-containing protein [Pseudomonas sp. MUP55]